MLLLWFGTGLFSAPFSQPLGRVIHRIDTTGRRPGDRDGDEGDYDIKTQGGSVGSAQLVDDAVDPSR